MYKLTNQGPFSTYSQTLDTLSNIKGTINRNTHVRMLFIGKLSTLGLNTPLCNWILDFLTCRPQSVRIGGQSSDTITLSTGSPQGCVLSPLLFTLLTHDCSTRSSSNHFIKFADDTTVVGLVTNNEETQYRQEVENLVTWCKNNNLSLNVDKTKEMVIRGPSVHIPLTINGTAVEKVHSIKFLGMYIGDDLKWSTNTSAVTKKTQKRLY